MDDRNRAILRNHGANPGDTWKTIPSWYIVSSEDRAINPDLERFYAKRAGAKTTEIKASHVPFLSHPKAVARVIQDAARQEPRSTD